MAKGREQGFEVDSLTSIISHSPPPQTYLVFLYGGCRTQSSMILVSTSTVTSTHHMLRPLHNGVV